MREPHLKSHVTLQLCGQMENQKRHIFSTTGPSRCKKKACARQKQIQKCQLELGMLRWSRSWVIWKFICITASVNLVASKLEEAATGGVQWKRFFNNLAKLTGKHLWRGILFNNVAGLIPAKKTLTPVFSCQFYETFEDIFSYGTLPGDCFWIGLMVKKINLCHWFFWIQNFIMLFTEWSSLFLCNKEHLLMKKT